MTLEECYHQLNGNYEEVLKRLMKESFVDRFILKFPEDDSILMLRRAIAENDLKEAFRAAHTLKGVSANLSFTRLTESVSVLTEQLRPMDHEIDMELVKLVETQYAIVIKAINKYSSEK